MSGAGPGRLPSRLPGEVRYGTAGWVFEDWYGAFYPTGQEAGPGPLFTGVPDTPGAAADVRLARRTPLAYYARFFDVVEVNATFYGTPPPRAAAAWLRDAARAGAGRRPFLFVCKAPMAFTHEGFVDPGALRAFRAALAPLAERGALAAVLAQFPASFSCTPAAWERVARLREALPGALLVVEVRHHTWHDDGALERLRAHEVTLANVDMPQDATSLRPAALVTTPGLAYVRLHGRNAAAWFGRKSAGRKAGRDARYDYLYDAGEVREWAGRVEGLAARAERTIVIANNHFRGQAPANALELRAAREGPLAVPSPLLAAFPRLAALARDAGTRDPHARGERTTASTAAPRAPAARALRDGP